MLCNRVIQVVIAHDKRKRFKFATLQSTYGAEAKKIVGTTGTDTVILRYKGKYYTKSEAALRIALILGGGWRLMTIFFIVPRFVRDRLYDWLASNRYKWFGKNDRCMIPDASVHERFLHE